jgi:NADH:ubiquinone oxidoreductase subunit 6 (subunit J)
MARPSKRLEIVVAVVALAAFTTFLLLSLNIELRQEAAEGQIGARFWPTVIGVSGLVIALWRVVLTLVTPADDRDDIERIQPGGFKRLGLTLVFVVAYLALWQLRTVDLFGYRINLFLFITVVFLAAVVAVYGAKSWKPIVIYPVVITAFIYVLFGILLRIPL